MCGESSEGHVNGGDPVQVRRYVVGCCPGAEVALSQEAAWCPSSPMARPEFAFLLEPIPT